MTAALTAGARRGRGAARPRGLGVATRLDKAGWAAAVAAGGGLAVITLARTFIGAPGIDVPIFDQALWKMTHGQAHVSIMDRNVFADHLAPVLAVFAALYHLAATPAWLVGAQSFAVGAAVFPARRLAEWHGLPRRVGTLALLANGPLLMSGLSDFHTSTLAVPAVAWAVLAAYTDDRRTAVWAAAAALFCRTDLAIVLVGVALLARRGSGTRRLLFGGAAVGALATVVPTLLGSDSVWHIHYSRLGDGMADAALHPWRIVPALLTPGAALSLATWLLPAGFLLLRTPRVLAALLVAGAPILLIGDTWRHLPVWHYAGPTTPIVVAGVLAALAGLEAGRRRRRGMLVLQGGLLAALVLASPMSPLLPSRATFWGAVQPGPQVLVDLPMDLVADDDTVAVSKRLLPRFAHRHAVYGFPSPFVADDAVLPASPAQADSVDVVVVLHADLFRFDGLASAGFEPVFADDDLTVFRRVRVGRLSPPSATSAGSRPSPSG